MAEKINLEEHIARGVEKIVSDTLKATWKDPRESAFMLKFASASRKATKIRQKLAERTRKSLCLHLRPVHLHRVEGGLLRHRGDGDHQRVSRGDGFRSAGDASRLRNGAFGDENAYRAD